MANFFSKAIEKLQGRKSQIITPQQQGVQFLDFNNVTTWSSVTDQNTAYYLENCPPLATIINRKAMAFINGKVEVLDANTDNYVQGKHKQWEDLLKKPNAIQTEKQYMAQLYSYIQAYGYCPVLIKQPAGFKDYSRISSMWILPPQYCKITLKPNYLNTNSIREQIDQIVFTYCGESTIINPKDVYIFKDTGTNLLNLLYPDSKLFALKYPINNIIKNYEARGTIAEKRGAIGILSNTRSDAISTLPMREEEKQQLQADYSRYGFSKNQWQLIITNASLSYQSMTMPIMDMMLLEMETADTMAIADAFGYPSVLLANEKGTTYSNQEGAKRALYQDTIVPESMNYTEQLNDALHTKENGIKIQYDYTWLPILQMDEKLRAEVIRIASEAYISQFEHNAITFNEMRKGLYLDIIPNMDKYYYELYDKFNKNGNINPTISS